MQQNRRQFLLASGVAVAGAGALSGAAGAETETAPTAENPSSYDYPTTGTDSETPVATVYGGFDCPYTADMIEESWGDILEEFIEPGRLRLTFRALEYDENGDPYISDDGVMTGQAAGGVWERDPEAFWDFFAAVYDEMPGDMSKEKIERIMKDAGVDDAEYIADNLEEWDPELRETADDAQEEGVEWTPTIELKGDLGNRENVVEWIEERLDDEDGSDDSDSSDESDDSDDSDESDDSDDSDSEDTSDDGSESDQSQQSAEASEDDSDDDDSDDSDDDDSDDSDDDDSDDSDDDDSDDSDDDDSDDSDDDSDDSDGGHDCAPDDGGDSQASQSFVFPEASGSRRSL